MSGKVVYKTAEDIEEMRKALDAEKESEDDSDEVMSEDSDFVDKTPTKSKKRRSSTTKAKDLESRKHSKSNTENDSWPSKYAKFVFTFEDESQLAYINIRRLGRIWLLEDPTIEEPISKLGPDPLLDMPSLKQFTEMLRPRKAFIKPLLMDQSFMAGIGNWIADEVLYQSKIHPQKKTDALLPEHIKSLHKNIRHIITTAVKSNESRNRFPSDWLFHVRWSKSKKEKMKTAKNEEIEFVTVGGRTSAFVPDIQKLTEEEQEAIVQNQKKRKRKDTDDSKTKKKPAKKRIKTSSTKKSGDEPKSQKISKKKPTKAKTQKKTVKGESKKRKREVNEESDFEETPKKRTRKSSKKSTTKTKKVVVKKKKKSGSSASTSTRKKQILKKSNSMTDFEVSPKKRKRRTTEKQKGKTSKA